MKYLINNIVTDWKDIIDKEFQKDYIKEIDDFLFNQKKIIFPQKQNIFRAFDYFNIKDTLLVIFGQDPYHNINQANGLAFSTFKTNPIPKSLQIIFKKLKQELNIDRTNPDISDWAKQGVLLLNTCLTVNQNEPRSHHNIGWDKFIKQIINVLNNCNHPIVFLLMGNDAISLKKYINSKHHIITNCHPSPLSAYSCGFFDRPIFKEINDFTIKNYNKMLKW